MDDTGQDALPQRPNARRRRREQLGDVEISAGESSGRAGALQPDYGGGGADSTYAEAADACAGGYGGDGGDGSYGASDLGRREIATSITAAAEKGPPEPRGDVEDSLPAYRSAAVGSYKFEYLDHTADIQLHAWGGDLKEAFENCALAMFNYMSPLQHVEQRESRTYRAEGHDLPSLLFAFLDELLFVFSTELFLAASVTITSFDRSAFVIVAEGRGEAFDRSRHEVGTEIKAITYSAMSITECADDAEVFVIVDI